MCFKTHVFLMCVYYIYMFYVPRNEYINFFPCIRREKERRRMRRTRRVLSVDAMGLWDAAAHLPFSASGSRHRRRHRRRRCYRPSARTSSRLLYVAERCAVFQFDVWRTAAVCATMEVQRQYKGRKIMHNRIRYACMTNLFAACCTIHDYTYSLHRWYGRWSTADRRKSILPRYYVYAYNWRTFIHLPRSLWYRYTKNSAFSAASIVPGRTSSCRITFAKPWLSLAKEWRDSASVFANEPFWVFYYGCMNTIIVAFFFLTKIKVFHIDELKCKFSARSPV